MEQSGPIAEDDFSGYKASNRPPVAGWLMLAGTVTTLCVCMSLHASPSPTSHGYFTVGNRGGVWWLIWPDGNTGISIGLDTIRYEGDRVHRTGVAPYLEAVRRKYHDRSEWEIDVLARLRRWGFNSIGAWSDRGLWSRQFPYTVILNIADRAGADWERGVPVDVYNPRFEQAARDIAQQECASRSSDPYLLGYFSDNELRWGSDWRGKETMLDMYLKLPRKSPGRNEAVNFLRRRYKDEIAPLNEAWNTNATDFDSIPPAALTGREPTEAHHADADQFLTMVADRYFQVCARAIHQADPNHMYLGARFAGRPPDAALRAARVADIVSINIYGFDPRPLVQHVYELTGRPVLVTEFAFRATDSGLPNTQGAGPKVPDQHQRAKAYADYVSRLEALPESVGYHWFQWSDEPKEGRFDGENSNYGFVNITDEPYLSFVEAAAAANRTALDIHRRSAAQQPGAPRQGD